MKTRKRLSPEFVAGKWWFYLLLVVIYFWPPYASKGYDPSYTQSVVFAILGHSLQPYRLLAPFFHVATVVLVVLLIFFGNRITRIFSVYASLNFFFIAVAQSTAVTEEYGFGVLPGGLICFLIVGIFWAREVKFRKNDFSSRRIPAWKLWVVPLAALSFWSPLKPDFAPIYLLTSYYGLAFCLTTPIFLSVLSLYYPNVNIATLRVTSFFGILLGLLNISLAFMGGNTWVSGVLHAPLLIISFYTFVLSLGKAGQKSRGPDSARWSGAHALPYGGESL